MTGCAETVNVTAVVFGVAVKSPVGGVMHLSAVPLPSRKRIQFSIGTPGGLPVLANLSAVAAVFFTACGQSGNTSDHPPSPTPAPIRTVLSGHVTWPDGTPAAKVPLTVASNGLHSGAPAEFDNTDSSGHYSSQVCTVSTCSDLQANVSVLPDSKFPAGCELQMTADRKAGGVVNWQIQSDSCQVRGGGVAGGPSWDEARTLLQHDPSALG